jgi:serine/threonine protein kinase
MDDSTNSLNSDLSGVVVAFQSAWESGLRPDLTEFLRRLSAKDRTAALPALFGCEVVQRLRRGEIPRPRDYVEMLSEFDIALQSIEPLFEHLYREESAVPVIGGETTRSESSAGSLSTLVTPDIQLPLARPKKFGNYELLGELGRGGMGVVYRARQQGTERDVAVKMILAGALAGESERAKFLREARMNARLDHPNIVTVFEVSHIDDHPYIAMALVDGPNLRQFMQDRPLTVPQTIRIMVQVADAVAHAHSRGVVHRDIKPQNIFVASDGRVRVGDFGLAKDYSEPTEFTPSVHFAGTPEYMSPEQASGNSREATPAADVYSLGATLYTLLTGAPPFRASRGFDVLRLVVSKPPVPPDRIVPDIPGELSAICLRCLEKNPLRRFSSAADFATALRQFESRLESNKVSSPTVFSHVPRPAWNFAGLAATVFLLSLAAWKWSYPGSPNRPQDAIPTPRKVSAELETSLQSIAHQIHTWMLTSGMQELSLADFGNPPGKTVAARVRTRLGRNLVDAGIPVLTKPRPNTPYVEGAIEAHDMADEYPWCYVLRYRIRDAHGKPVFTSTQVLEHRPELDMAIEHVADELPAN